jgi:N-methylhydantoinase B
METKVRNFVEGNWICEPPKRGENCPAWGLWEGNAGQVGDYQMRKPGEDTFHIVEKARNSVQPETEVLVRTGGGGGWGNPLDRDAELVSFDVAEGLVSIVAAKNSYGVVLDPNTFNVDVAATGSQRSKMRATQQTAEQ